MRVDIGNAWACALAALRSHVQVPSVRGQRIHAATPVQFLGALWLSPFHQRRMHQLAHLSPFARFFSILATTVSLVGCMSTQVASLRDASAFETKSPSSDFRHVDEGSSLRAARIVKLAGGTYKPAGQDERGVWYIGPSQNLSIFYTERKRSDGKRLLSLYTGGVLVPHGSDSGASVFLLPSSEQLLLVSDTDVTGAPATSPPGETLASAFETSKGSSVTLATSAGSALGGTIADALLAYDAKGFRLVPLDTKDVAAWFNGR